jgi:hypothetical protein
MELERRRHPRIYHPIPVRVCGVNAGGKAFEFDTIAKDVSAGGICAPAPRLIIVGEELSLQIRFSLAGSSPSQAPTVSARGTVLRSSELADGTFQFAAALIQYRLV